MNKHFPLLLILVISIIFGCDNSNQKKNTAINSNIDSLTIVSDLLIKDSLNPQLFAARSILLCLLTKPGAKKFT